MSVLSAVEVPRRPVSLLEPVIGASRYGLLARGANLVRHMLAGRTIWNVNSTAAGGGVAEMLQWNPSRAHTTAVARFVHAALTAHLPPGWHTQPDHLRHRE